jgi:adenylate kinase family enzyme
MIGINAQSYISKGQLVPDEIVIEALKNELTYNSNKNGIIQT